jgi:hypothetical protein
MKKFPELYLTPNFTIAFTTDPLLIRPILSQMSCINIRISRLFITASKGKKSVQFGGCV